MKTTRITLHATVIGYMWMPNCPAKQDFHISIRHKRDRSDPWAYEFDNLRSLLLSKAQSGDLQGGGKLYDAYIQIERTGSGGKWVHNRIVQIRPTTTGVKDLFCTDEEAEKWEWEYFDRMIDDEEEEAA